MAVPGAEFRTGGDALQPNVDRRFLLADASQPEALDEDAQAIVFGGWLISSFKFDHVQDRRRAADVSPPVV
jgi:hypothetical protein